MSETGTEKRARAATPPPGVTPPSATSAREGFLSDVIVELGFATPETVEEAVRAARNPGATVAHVLVETKSISEDQLARATAERYGIDHVDLEAFEVNPAAANLIDPEAARRHGVVPVGFFGPELMVATADPADAPGVDELAALSGHEVRPAVASRPALDALLEALPFDQPAAAGPVEQPGHPDAGEPAAAEPEGDSPLRAELDGARSRVREAKEVSAELETLREALAAAEAGLHARAREGDPKPSEASELRARLGSMRSERDLARSQMREVESQLRRIVADVRGAKRRVPRPARAAHRSGDRAGTPACRSGDSRLPAPGDALSSRERRGPGQSPRRRSPHGEGRALGERDLLDMLGEEKPF